MPKMMEDSPISIYPENSKPPSFTLHHVSLIPELLVTYFNQALDASFGFSEMLMEYIWMKGKTRDALSKEEIMEALGAFDLQPPPSLYHFGEQPCHLFTRIQQVSFERGGLMVLELFNTQLYELYTARGHRLLGPCHDLELLPAGKFLYRGASVEDVFRLAQINIEEESITDSAIVFDNEFDDCFCIGNRDILQIKVDTSKRIRIENFLTPTNAHEAEKILNAPDSNWIASPELVRYFRSSKALAKIAVTRYSVAYSLLTEELKHDSEIIRTLCLESDLAYHGSLNSYFKEWNINPEDHLSASEVFILIESGRLRTD